MKIQNVAKIFYRTPKFLNPGKVIDSLDLKEGDIVCDYGAGVGFWTIPLAKKVGKKGKVYALSSNPAFISLIKKKTELSGLSNIISKEIQLDEGKIKIEERADLVVISNVLHVSKNPDLMIENAKSFIKETGQVLIIDYMKLKSIFGPPLRYRFSEEEVIVMAEKVGLKFKCLVDAGWYHYGLLFSLPDKY